MTDTELRYNAYLDAMNAHSLTVDPALVSDPCAGPGYCRRHCRY
jgi:hypothetical protein